MKLKAAQKLKFGDRVFVKHSCEQLNVAGKYAEVINHPIGTGNPVYGSSNWVDVSKTGNYAEDHEWASVSIEDLKRVNVLPKDCVAGTKVRIKSDAESSYSSERGKVVEVIELNKRGSSCYYGHAKVTCSSYGEKAQHVKLSELELYYE